MLIDDFQISFDRKSIQDELKQAEEERLEIVKKFPLNDFAHMTKAWKSIREIYLHAFGFAKAKRWNEIDQLLHSIRRHHQRHPSASSPGRHRKR